MRRTFTLALALSLAGLGPVPLSACALVFFQLAECETPSAQSLCEQMDMHQSGSQLDSVPDTSCCHIAKAPLPESQFEASDLTLLPAPTSAVALDLVAESASAEKEHLADVVQDISPPPLQPLLCTFLI
jgi:hypothetical protein